MTNTNRPIISLAKVTSLLRLRDNVVQKYRVRTEWNSRLYVNVSPTSAQQILHASRVSKVLPKFL